MKVTVLWSSPNADGLTASAAKEFIAGLKEAGTEVDVIPLNRMKIAHCAACGDGWGKCRSEGHCALKDDFEDIYRRLTESDGIVFVSAVYWGDLTECMKAFVDRLRRCEASHNHFLAEKRCVLVACAGGTGRGTLSCLSNLETALSHMGMRAYDRISVVRYNRDYMLPALKAAGAAYADRLENGFDMYF